MTELTKFALNNKMTDIVYLHGISCPSTIGVWAWEQKITQTLKLDIDLATNVEKAASEDNLSDALDYQAVAKQVQAFAQENQFALIETLIERLAELILREFDTPWVRIKLDKGPAVQHVAHVGVIIERGTKP